MHVCVNTQSSMYRNLVHLWGNTGLNLMQDLSILHRNSICNVAYLPMSMDLPSVFKIDKIQDQSVSTTYLKICLYSHQQLAFSKLRLLAIIAKIPYQKAWPMTLAPTYEAIKHENQWKTFNKGETCRVLGHWTSV